MSFLTVFGPWGNYSGILAQKLQKVCQKCSLYVPKNSRRITTFGRFVKTALYLSEWDFWLSFFLINFLSFVNVFWLWSEKSTTLAQELQRSCQKCILLEQQNFSRKDCFLKKLFTFTIFSSLMENSADFCQKGFAPIWKTAFYTGSGGLLA